MAKTQGPLLSLSAHGTVSNLLTFARRLFKNVVRFQRPQKDYTNLARTTQRGYFAEAVEKWHTLNSAEQKQWDDFNAS